MQLECIDCIGPVRKGITLVYPLATLLKNNNNKKYFQNTKSESNNNVEVFRLLLNEKFGWLKDPQNTLLPWSPPSQCDLIQVLSRLSAIKILGILCADISNYKS